MLILEHQLTGKQRRVDESEINDMCLILAATDPFKPTGKERARAEVYKDRIMLQSRTIQAAGVRVWRVKEHNDSEPKVPNDALKALFKDAMES